MIPRKTKLSKSRQLLKASSSKLLLAFLMDKMHTMTPTPTKTCISRTTPCTISQL